MNDLAYSDALKELYLEHHGVKGQKWGVRRTPAQLGHKGASSVSRLMARIKKAKKKHTKNVERKREESDEEIREKVLKSTDPKFIYKHRALLSTQELQGRIDRMNKEKTLRDMAEPKGGAYKAAKKGEDWLKTASAMTKSVSEIYTSMNVIKSISEKGVKAKDENQNLTFNIGGKKDKKKDKKDNS